MRPLFSHQPILLGCFIAGLILWRVMETFIDIASARRLTTGVERRDRGSRWVLLVCIIAGIFGGTVVAFQVPAAGITSARGVSFGAGVVLIYAGLALRFYAIRTLGAFFTTSVAVSPKQPVIATGPYRVMRHPSYTGMLLIVLGYALCLTNWLSLPLVMGLSLAGLAYRIRVEERALLAQLGQPYQDYMRRVKRLIPWVV